MDPRRSTRAYSFRAAHPVWQRAFLTSVATALARAPSGHALFVEQRASANPTLVPLRPDLEAAIVDASTTLPGTLDRYPMERGAPSPAPSRCAFLVGPPAVVERSTRASTTFSDDGHSSPPDAADRPAVGGLSRIDRSLTVRTVVQSHWFPAGSGRLRVWTRVGLPVGVGAPSNGELLASALGLARSFGAASGVAVGVLEGAVRAWNRSEWNGGGLRYLRRDPPVVARPESVPSVLPPLSSTPFPDPSVLERHTVVVGASGSGKTALLAGIASDRIRRGHPAVVFDLHGDLGPAVVARLPPAARRRVAAIDAEQPTSRRAGVAILGGDDPETASTDATDLVAALKRLSSDGAELYWGFRLERVFDTFVRLAQEEGGSLVDVAELLTDERRRDAARFSTRRPEIARFLDELPAILRRSPEFLWPAAARLSKVLLDDRLKDLLAPPHGGVPLRSWFSSGGSIVFRLPFPVLGPEASSFAATLLATRTYLALVRLGRSQARARTALFVVDEAHAISSRLLTEVLSEGRKFHVGAVLATQYPERLAPDLRAAAAGAAGSHVVFRVPSASARAAGTWVGLGPAESESLLPALPVGRAVAALPGEAPRLIESPPIAPDSGAAWEAVVAATATEFGADPDAAPSELPVGGSEEAVLLALFDGQARGDHLSIDRLRAVATERRADLAEPGSWDRLIDRMVRRGWVEVAEGVPGMTRAGARYLGVGGPTGAVSESAEHRALVLSAMRIFARHGERLELVRQGRFDTRLPDAVLRLLTPEDRGRSPEELRGEFERRRRTWAWRSFGGRDVHVEAEVSGAERPPRIRRGLAKAAARRAFALFLVADARKARRVKEVLVRAGAFPHDARVWTLRDARAREAERDVHRP
ncbi:MAG TPA: type IV secretion system DNA-binding domain-containing protein [Thermoplasmata archaeon]